MFVLVFRVYGRPPLYVHTLEDHDILVTNDVAKAMAFDTVAEARASARHGFDAIYVAIPRPVPA